MEQDTAPVEEIVKLAAIDTLFFGRVFFPKTFRQPSPEFHRGIITTVEAAANRYIAIKVFRDGAKTTLLRVFCAKRIAYGLSRTIMIVSASQSHAIRSVRWIKKQIEFNTNFAQTYGLVKGSKWTDEELEIKNTVLDITISVVAAGITGQTRGVNIDDYRPDLILVDDPCDEENTKTPEQRQKTEDLLGSLQKGLAPVSENPDAKMVILQTPLNREDAIELRMKDTQWASLACSCFDAEGRSTWEARRSTAWLQAEKEAHIARNQLSLWLREMEVTVVSRELATFLVEWLQYWDVLPEGMMVYIGVDPTPPPRAGQENTSNAHLDDACISAIGLWRGRVYLIEYYVCKSPNPMEFIVKLFEMVRRLRPISVGVETILFARTLSTLINDEMQRLQFFFLVIPVEDKRNKMVRITQALTGRASQHMLYVSPKHTEFIDQFATYPDVAHDDILDAVSIALGLINPYAESGNTYDGEFVREQEKSLEKLPNFGRCP
jgi:hypothetical protein